MARVWTMTILLGGKLLVVYAQQYWSQIGGDPFSCGHLIVSIKICWQEITYDVCWCGFRCCLSVHVVPIAVRMSSRLTWRLAIYSTSRQPWFATHRRQSCKAKRLPRCAWSSQRSLWTTSGYSVQQQRACAICSWVTSMSTSQLALAICLTTLVRVKRYNRCRHWTRIETSSRWISRVRFDSIAKTVRLWWWAWTKWSSVLLSFCYTCIPVRAMRAASLTIRLWSTHLSSVFLSPRTTTAMRSKSNCGKSSPQKYASFRAHSNGPCQM